MTRVSQRILLCLGVLLLAATALSAQQLPAGTLLPVMLDKTLDSDKSKPGEQITSKLKQDVPLPDGGQIKSGAEVLGKIVSVSRASGNVPAKIVIVLNQLRAEGRETPISTSLRAVASMQAVFDARQPLNGGSEQGSSVWDWTTRQVGGDLVFRGQKLVKSRAGNVGTMPQPGWVLGVPRANPESGCAASDNNAIQAFWIFSTDACGVYGMKDVQISRTPADSGSGQITLLSPTRIQVRNGGGLLLMVQAPPPQ